MPFTIVRNDITKMPVDAIVNAANETLLGGGGVDGAIHRAAGPGLLAECRTLGGCPTGQARITSAYRLPCRYVIHTVGPVWRGGSCGEKPLLASAYRASLELAAAHGCQTVAFPLISSGAYGYPKAQALEVAVDAIRGFLQDHDMTVYLVVFDRAAFCIGGELYRDIAAYIDDRYVDAHLDAGNELNRYRAFGAPPAPPAAPARPAPPAAPAHPAPPAPVAASLFTAALPRDLRDALAHPDESFSQMLLRKIDERGLTDAQCYKKANIDRKLFSKIRSDVHYKPSKPTAMAFAVALELPLAKAGFAFSHASRFDIIVEYFISRGIYDIFSINEALFAFDQSLLGG